MLIFIHIIFSYLGTVAFGIITNIPRKALHFCGFTGMIGWMIYWLANTHDLGLGLSNFLGALSIGLASIFFSRKKRMPMIIFNIPSLVPLVPGGPAYKVVREILLQNYPLAFQNLILVVITAGAIAAGFMVTTLFEQVLSKHARLKKASETAKKTNKM